MFVRRFSRCKQLQRSPAVAYRMNNAYGQTADAHNIFASALCGCHECPHYNLSPAVKICRRHRRMRSSSASRKDYRLVVNCTTRTATFIHAVQRFKRSDPATSLWFSYCATFAQTHCHDGSYIWLPEQYGKKAGSYCANIAI